MLILKLLITQISLEYNMGPTYIYVQLGLNVPSVAIYVKQCSDPLF